MTFTENFTIKALAPFDFNLCVQIFSNGDPQIRAYVNRVFHQMLKIIDRLALVNLSSLGTVQQRQK
ncbi:MAG TPA: hypothetical protein VK253_02835 [Candidatus Binatia bacterium]|nr:hypothetical protein [Candidatus Binatia bacterium]